MHCRRPDEQGVSLPIQEKNTGTMDNATLTRLGITY
jgi:hypothetical protein